MQRGETWRARIGATKGAVSRRVKELTSRDLAGDDVSIGAAGRWAAAS